MKVPNILAFAITASLAAQQQTPPAPRVGDLQYMIDHAAPGDVLTVAGTFDPVIIDKPIAIIGDPTFVIVQPFQAKSLGSAQNHPPAITLKGPGSGRVEVVGLWAKSQVTMGLIAFNNLVSPTIEGSGFDELIVTSSTVHAAWWDDATGFVWGKPAIDLPSMRVTLVGSDVLGGVSDTGGGILYFAPDAAPGIVADEVIVTDSQVTGGDAGVSVWEMTDPGMCPCSQGTGRGGDAIIAKTVWATDSQIVGGQGSKVYFGPCCPRQPRGQQPNGNPVVGTLHTIAGGYNATPRARLGQTWTLTGPRLGVVALGPPAGPTPLGGSWLFLTPGIALPFPGSLSVPVPNAPALLGARLVAQVFNVNAERPVFVVVTR